MNGYNFVSLLTKNTSYSHLLKNLFEQRQYRGNKRLWIQEKFLLFCLKLKRLLRFRQLLDHDDICRCRIGRVSERTLMITRRLSPSQGSKEECPDSRTGHGVQVHHYRESKGLCPEGTLSTSFWRTALTGKSLGMEGVMSVGRGSLAHDWACLFLHTATQERSSISQASILTKRPQHDF